MPQVSLEDVKRIVDAHGPIIPNDIRKRAGASDSTLINVYLAQLTQDNRILKTSLKLGSSPFYHNAQQRPQLAELTEHLGEKDRRTAQRLKHEGVLRAADEDPLGRVSLSNIPDFAKPIQVKTGEGEELFYRWFLLAPEEAKERITRLLSPTPEPQNEPEAKEEPAIEETAAEEPQPPAPAEEEPEEEDALEEPIEPALTKREAQATLEHDIQAESPFAKQLLTYLDHKGIAVTDLDEVRKDSEIDCTVKLPTPVGPITYFCKAKNKKSSNDGDLAQAILQARRKMLPALYITSGTVTQKAKDAPELRECKVIEWA